MIKRILTNILLIFFVFGIVEYAAFVKTKNENMIFKSQADKLEANNTVNYRTKYTILKDFNTTIYRNSFISEKTDKKPVIWFGCSFAEGAGLEDNQTPCYKISQLTGRSCINRSKGATGTQFMYYQLLNPDFIKASLISNLDICSSCFKLLFTSHILSCNNSFFTSEAKDIYISS